MVNPVERMLDRRGFLGRSAGALGLAALAELGGVRAARGGPHFAPRCRRVIFLFQAGAPSQIDLFDPKPALAAIDGQPMPASLAGSASVNDQLEGRRLIAAGSPFRFRRRGESGLEVSELLPHIGAIADRLCVIRSMQTDALNHDPALTLMQTGHPVAGRPCMGAWASYGLGAENSDLPTFSVLVSNGRPFSNPVNARLWGAGFLPGRHQGVELRAAQDPVLFLNDHPGVDRGVRRDQLDAVRALNERWLAATGDPEIATRIAAYELAHRMQVSVPELVDLRDESAETLALYGAARDEPSFARNCLLARRMAERGVRFVQLYHRGWDHHYQLPRNIRRQCAQVDRASAALVLDLERRGMLDDTLVVWGGEFGRTPMNQGGQGGDRFGRDHWGRAFTIWMAGGGVRVGTVLGRTDDLGFDVVTDPVHVHDLQATILHLLGFDHERLTFRTRGRDFRLTDVAGRVVTAALA